MVITAGVRCNIYVYIYMYINSQKYARDTLIPTIYFFTILYVYIIHLLFVFVNVFQKYLMFSNVS